MFFMAHWPRRTVLEVPDVWPCGLPGLVQSLYTSGAGTSPGGGVTDALRSNAAREVLHDIKRSAQ